MGVVRPRDAKRQKTRRKEYAGGEKGAANERGDKGN